MKIGIVTYYRSQNYGAQLQTFALQTFLKKNGYDAKVSRYWPDYHDLIYKQVFFDKRIFSSKTFFKKIKYLVKAAVLSLLFKKRSNEAVVFSEKKLDLSAENIYDVAIYGSDQIWRKQHKPGCESYNPVYFGVGEIISKNKISYAASMGKIEIAGSDDMQFLEATLRMFSSISVREMDLQSLLVEQIGLKVERVCDPVFLLSADEWNAIFCLKKNKKTKYILLYNLHSIPEVDKIASELASEKGYKILKYYWTVIDMPKDCDDRITDGPISFLVALYNAEYVVTSSFHGVAFSIIFGKPFYYSSKPSLSNRVTSLLEDLKIKTTNMISTSYSDDTIAALGRFRARSVKWLISTLQECDNQ